MKATLDFTVQAKITVAYSGGEYPYTEEEEKQALIDTLKQYAGPNVEFTVTDFKLTKED